MLLARPISDHTPFKANQISLLIQKSCAAYCLIKNGYLQMKPAAPGSLHSALSSPGVVQPTYVPSLQQPARLAARYLRAC
jgi:hypothetical protein